MTYWLRLVVVIVALPFGAVGYELLRVDLGVERWEALVSIAVAWTFVVAGVVGWSRAPRIGMLITATGFALLWRKLQYSHHDFLFAAGSLGADVNYALFAHAVLAYPNGRLVDRAERALIGVGYAVTLLGPLATLLVYDTARSCRWNCGRDYSDVHNPLLVDGDPRLFDIVHRSYLAVLFGVLALALVALLIRKMARSTAAGRRVIAPLGVAGLAAGSRAIYEAIRTLVDIPEPAAGGVYVWQAAVQAAVPVAFVWGLVVSTLDRATVADLLLELERAPGADVRVALARALRDPTLEVAYWVPERRVYVDAGGTPVELPRDDPRRAVTVLDHEGEPVAALVHDPVDDATLVQAAGTAARLALENARLQAEVRAQLARVQESRRRIVAAGDEQRRKIERDLHDGAQQRLVALALELRAAQRRLGDGRSSEVDRVLELAVRELQTAVNELRELARGVHPAILTEDGLGAALESLASRTPLPVKIATKPESRLAPEIEAAAYFVACEALANAVKHAGASEVTISAARANAKLVIEVADDGVGGADAARGTGLRGLADRVEAHGGRLRVESAPGEGTRVVAEVPCAS